jgi:hypothetical protein
MISKLWLATSGAHRYARLSFHLRVEKASSIARLIRQPGINSRAGARSGRLIYADRMVQRGNARRQPGGLRRLPEDPPPGGLGHSPSLRWIALPTCGVALGLVTVVTSYKMPGQPPLAIAAAALALLMTVAGFGCAFLARDEHVLRGMAGLTAAGLAGALLTGLLPSGPGDLLIFMAMIGLGMELPPRMALGPGLIVAAAANLSFLLAEANVPSTSGWSRANQLAGRWRGAAAALMSGVPLHPHRKQPPTWIPPR